MDKDLIIVRSDGGACSQIAFAAFGKYFLDKGFKVKFDLTWFEDYGKELKDFEGGGILHCR